MQKGLLLFLSFALLALVGCSQETKTKPLPIAGDKLTIQFQTKPSKPMPNQPVKLQATIKKGKKPVENAKVELEVWKDGAKKHEMLKTKQSGKGIYTAAKAFAKAGKYQVIVHVTTPQTHQMINPSFTVGKAKEKKHSHHQSGLSMQMMLPKDVKSGAEETLTAHVKKEDKPLKEAKVRFEIWKEDSQKHEYIDAAEQKPGEYTAEFAFPKSGKYHVKLHVRKGDHLHDHKEKSLQVN